MTDPSSGKGTLKRETRLVRAGQQRSAFRETSEAMYLTQGFVYDTAEQAEARFISSGDDEFIYARYGNPTVRMFEERIAAIEGTEDAFATASGMAAVNGALTSMLKAGDHVVSSRALFGSCLYVLENVLSRFGVDVTIVEAEPDAVTLYRSRTICALAAQSKWQEAEHELELLLREEESAGIGYALRAIVRASSTEPQTRASALEDFRSAISAQPENHYLRFRFAQALLARGASNPARPA